MATMTPDQLQSLDDLSAWMMGFRVSGRTRREFWAEFQERAKDIEPLVAAEDADPDLRNYFGEIWSDAHDLYGAPEAVE